MFGACMRTTLSQRPVSINTAFCLRASLVQCFKLANEEDALVDVVENGEIVIEEMPSRNGEHRKGKDIERRRNGYFD